MAASGTFQPSILDKIYGNFGLDYSAGYMLSNLLCRFLSPYQLNPFNFNPLKKLARRDCRLPAHPSANSRETVSLCDQCSDLQVENILRQRINRRPRARFFMPALLDASGRD